MMTEIEKRLKKIEELLDKIESHAGFVSMVVLFCVLGFLFVTGFTLYHL